MIASLKFFFLSSNSTFFFRDISMFELLRSFLVPLPSFWLAFRSEYRSQEFLCALLPLYSDKFASSTSSTSIKFGYFLVYAARQGPISLRIDFSSKLLNSSREFYSIFCTFAKSNLMEVSITPACSKISSLSYSTMSDLNLSCSSIASVICRYASLSSRAMLFSS